jgi:hypothetical protein
VTVVAHVRRPIRRVPAGPLIRAAEETAAARGVVVRKLFGPTDLRAYRVAKAQGTLTVPMARRLCRALRCRQADVYGSALRPRRRRPKRRVPQPFEMRLDATPLVDAIDGRIRTIIRGLGPMTDPTTARREALYRVFGGDGTLKRAYFRARESPVITLAAAERLCDALEWHPREIWGDTYDRAAFGHGPTDQAA